VKVVLLGGTKGMGRALARLMVGDPVVAKTRPPKIDKATGKPKPEKPKPARPRIDLFLLGREEADAARSARDLEVRGSRSVNSVGSAVCDLAKPDTFGPALDAAERAMGGLDVVVVTAGLFATQDKLEADPAFTAKMLDANFTGTVLFCEEARKRLLARGGGTLCVFSSVAGERGRKPVILYGAAKAGLSHYLEGLDHKFSARGLKVITVKPGFVKTAMTAGLPAPPFAGEPEGVARQVLAAIERGRPVVYTPRIWGLIMLVIRLLPRAVMRKIGF
jgi:NAD(P)-dependent dehydrogenase (short-subunit alcohol dehydrogenase family)